MGEMEPSVERGLRPRLAETADDGRRSTRPQQPSSTDSAGGPTADGGSGHAEARPPRAHSERGGAVERRRGGYPA